MAMVEFESGQSPAAANHLVAAQPNILDVETRYREQRYSGVSRAPGSPFSCRQNRRRVQSS